MDPTVDIVGAGLAGSEAALQLAGRGVHVRLYEMRPETRTAVHRTGGCAELVCSNSLKSEKPESAAGMLKEELAALGSRLLATAKRTRVAAGGALAVDREAFSAQVTKLIESHPCIELVRRRIDVLPATADALICASGPLTGDALASSLTGLTGREHLSFYDAAAPIVMADSVDQALVFRQSRYEAGEGDYLNAPFSKEEYTAFIGALIGARRVIERDFETKELFQACQPVEEVARKGRDALRFGALKPVGLTDPRTGHRPWAALQLRAENAYRASYNLVGFQTNLTFPEQKRVFRMVPGLEKAEFARYGVMHRNTFIDAPRVLDPMLRLQAAAPGMRTVYIAGQLAGTEGYCEAIMSGLWAALCAYADLTGTPVPPLPPSTAFGALLSYASDPATADYQPMHVNFGIMEPLADPIKNKRERYGAYAARGSADMEEYCSQLRAGGLLQDGTGIDGY